MPERLARAAAITPPDAAIWRQLGVALLKQGSPEADAPLRRALTLNPAEAEGWSALGLHAESSGQAAEAETYYKKGAELTRRYRPKLALASYYARTHASEKFWMAASDAAAVEGAYLGRVFELAHDVALDFRAVPGLLQLRSEHSLAGYLSFLVETKRPGDVAGLSLSVPASEQHRERLFSAAERLIAERDVPGAVAVWNRLAAAGWTGTDPLDPAGGVSTTNPGFLPLPQRGFNWRAANLPGTAVVFRSSGGLRVEFTGQQPESSNVLGQWFPVAPGRIYRLRVRYATKELRHATGLRWSVQQPQSNFDLSGGSAVVEPVREGIAEAKFQSPAQTGLLRLVLAYARVPGTVRIEGDLTLLEARVDLAP